MTKATAPITGGISCPPFEAQASTAAASLADMPERFISGIVTTPTATVFAAAMPEIMPKRLEPITAIVAGHFADISRLPGLGERHALEAELQVGEREADAVAGGDELLGEKHEADPPEEIQRPGDRAGDEERGQRALRYPRQIPASLKYL